MRLALTLVASALSLTLAACGGGGSSAASKDNSSSSSASDTTHSGSTRASRVESATPISSAKLRTKLLTIDDLPPGYSANKLKSSDSSDRETHYFCNYKAIPAETLASQTFTNEQGLASSIFQVGIRRFASAATATEQMNLLKKTMQNCGGESYRGEKLTYSVISAPKLGSDRIGIRIEFKEGTSAEYFIVVGPDMVQVAMGGLPLRSQTIGDLTALANKQVTKVQGS